MIRILTVGAVAVALSVSGALGLAGQSDAPPEVSPPAQADASLPMSATGMAALVTSLQRRLREVPGDAPGWATLALAYVEQARTTGDATLYSRADEAVERSFAEQPDDNAAAQASASALAAARHDFATALERADEALAIDPFHAQALAVRVDALTELGRYSDQLRALRIADRRQPGLPVTTRYSYAFELRGELGRAASVLTRVGNTLSPSDRAFASTLQADLARRLGHLERAGSLLREAAAADPSYVPALVSRARLLVARGQLQRAAVVWEEVVRRLPLVEHLTELGELRLVLGQPQLAREEFAVVRTTRELFAANGVDMDLETALFEADHGSPAMALAAARAEWQRRSSVHVADVLAWALHRSGRDQQALRYARLATRLGTAEGKFWLHRGLIEAALGVVGPARNHLRQGLSTDPGASPWLAREGIRVLSGLEERR
jgi:tetratricopeptide (TPR) repeat protein